MRGWGWHILQLGVKSCAPARMVKTCLTAYTTVRHADLLMAGATSCADAALPRCSTCSHARLPMPLMPNLHDRNDLLIFQSSNLPTFQPSNLPTFQPSRRSPLTLAALRPQRRHGRGEHDTADGQPLGQAQHFPQHGHGGQRADGGRRAAEHAEHPLWQAAQGEDFQ